MEQIERERLLVTLGLYLRETSYVSGHVGTTYVNPTLSKTNNNNNSFWTLQINVSFS